MNERLIVVGAGGISNAWFPVIKAAALQVCAVVDTDLARAQERIAQYEVAAEASSDLPAMLAKYTPDFVLDLTIPEAHAQVTCTALEAGRHVVGEKPMAASLEEAQRMVAAAEATGRMYMVSQSRRWDVNHDTVRRTVQSGELGVLTTANCDFYIGAHFGGFRDEMDSPLILDMAIHHFDLVRFLTGADPVSVYAHEFNPYGSWYRGDAAASCIFEMTNGLVFTYRGSWCAEGCPTSWNGNWRLIGDKGTLLYEFDKVPEGQVVDGQQGFQVALRPAAIDVSPMTRLGFDGGLHEMLAYLRDGQTPQTECHDNIKSLAMVFAAIESSRSGMRVPVRW